MELEHEGECIVLAVPDAVLGRTSASEIHVVHPLVSRQHCRFEATRDGVYVEDLGSSNGTFLNGTRLTGRQSMRPGDVVQIGHGGPQFVLLSAVVDGRDVASGAPGEDEETFLAGDPRAAGLTAQVRVAPDAAPPGFADFGQVTGDATVPSRLDPQTTGSIPVATPIGTGGESLLGATDLLPGRFPEPPTQRVAPRPVDDPNDRTRRAGGGGVGPAEADPPTVAVPRQSPAAAPAAAHPDARSGGRGGGVVIGFLLGVLLVVALGVVTPLGRILHGMAPWAQHAAEDAR